MKRLLTLWHGAYLYVDEELSKQKPFPLDPQAVADRLHRIRRGEVLDEERALLEPDVIVDQPRLRELGHYDGGAPWPTTLPGVEDASVLHRAALIVGRDDARGAHGEHDRSLVQLVRAYDDVLEAHNQLVERLREWYALHYPELVNEVPDAQRLVHTIATSADREEAHASVAEATPPAMGLGAALPSQDLAAIQGFATAIEALGRERERMEHAVDAACPRVAPTLAGVVGPRIAARLVAHAGSLERLAMLPSGTVQTLGAENALFLHLKEGRRPPKHGVLYQHPAIHQAPKWQRGRAARILAASACMAARLDHFASAPIDRSGDLRARMEGRLERLRTSQAPTKRPRPVEPPRNRHKRRMETRR